MNSEYLQNFDSTFRPTLLRLGFEKVVLSSCVSYDVLYRKEELWLGSTWDFRDQYLEFGLGHLFSFRDVAPRFIILGDYSDYCEALKELQPYTPSYMSRYLDLAFGSLTESIAIYEKSYSTIKAKYLNSRFKNSSEYRHLLGNQVTKDMLAIFEI